MEAHHFSGGYLTSWIVCQDIELHEFDPAKDLDWKDAIPWGDNPEDLTCFQLEFDFDDDSELQEEYERIFLNKRIVKVNVHQGDVKLTFDDDSSTIVCLDED